jgi:hypothetical protein
VNVFPLRFAGHAGATYLNEACDISSFIRIGVRTVAIASSVFVFDFFGGGNSFLADRSALSIGAVSVRVFMFGLDQPLEPAIQSIAGALQ